MTKTLSLYLGNLLSVANNPQLRLKPLNVRLLMGYGCESWTPNLTMEYLVIQHQ